MHELMIAGRGQVLFVPSLDELCRKASLPQQPAGRVADPGLVVYVATQIDIIGGHTKLIEDIVAALPGKRHLLVLTAMQPSTHPFLTALIKRFASLGVEVRPLKPSSPIDKVFELSSLISSVAPRTVFLAAHQFDVVASIGVKIGAAPQVVFLHHADYEPSLGASRTDYLHIDLIPACHQFCKSYVPALLLPLTTQDLGLAEVKTRQRPIGVTCGSASKYLGFVEFSYGQLAAALFHAGVENLVHIGEVPSKQKGEIRREIGPNAGRLEFIGNVPSLAAELIKIAPDFYLSSHPIGGGKAIIEALSVGLPILFPCPASTPTLMNSDLSFGAGLQIERLDEVPAALMRAKRERQNLGRIGRAVYEQRYSAAAFRDKLLTILGGDWPVGFS